MPQTRRRQIGATVFGIRSKDGNFFIGESPISFEGDDMMVGNKTYKGTPGLWELMTMKEPNKSIIAGNDRADYGEILITANAIQQPDNPNKPKSSSSKKYKEFIKPIWEAKIGKGVVVIPQDPNALVEMLSLRIAS